MINPFRFCVNGPTRNIMVADVPGVVEESQSTSDEALSLSTDSTETSVKSNSVYSNDSNGAAGLVLHFPLSTEDSSNSPAEHERASASPVSVRTKKLLIFTLSEEINRPHGVGIKRMTEEEIREEEGEREGLQWPETDEFTLPNTIRDIGGSGRSTNVDYRFNMHGEIIGMALSPDQR